MPVVIPAFTYGKVARPEMTVGVAQLSDPWARNGAANANKPRARTSELELMVRIRDQPGQGAKGVSESSALMLTDARAARSAGDR